MAAISAKDVKSLRDQTGAGMMDCKRALSEAGGDSKKAIELLRERGLAKAGKREGRATTEGGIGIFLDGGVGGMVEVGCETDFVARTDKFVALANVLAEAVAAGEDRTTPESLLGAVSGGRKIGDLVAEAIAALGENLVVKRVARLMVDGVVGGYVHVGGKLGVLVALRPSNSGSDTLAKDIAMHIAAADPTPLAVTRDDVPGEIIESERSIYTSQARLEGRPEKIIGKIVEGKINKYLSQVCLVEQAFVKDPDRSVGEVLGDLTVVAFERFKLGEASDQ